MNPLCDFVVLTFNKIDVTKNFVKSLLVNTSLPIRVIFVDNASHDGTRDYLRSLKESENCHFEIILNENNLGFIKGVNQGLAKAQAPFICIANNDLTFTPGWLEEIIALFHKRPEVGLLNPNSNNLGVAPSAQQPLEDFAFVLKKYSGEFIELTDCIGFCMVLKTEVLEKVGFLSEEFLPMFFEDTDYSRRVSQAGWRVGMARASYVWHQEHSSILQLGDERQKIFDKSKEAFLKKWGRTLRLGWVVDGQDLDGVLAKAITIARLGNYVWLLVKNLKRDRRKIFSENNSDELADIKFVPYQNEVQLLWNVLIKKKKYDYVIVQGKPLPRLLQFFGQKTLDPSELNRISALKKLPAYKINPTVDESSEVKEK